MYWFLVLVVFLVLLTSAWYTIYNIKVGNNISRYVLVTGCDSGFGNLLTKQLDLLGFHVFAGCLTHSGAESVKSECSDNVMTIQMGVSDEESIKQAVDAIRTKIPREKVNEGFDNILNTFGSSNFYEVVGAYIHAITSRFPRKRYVVGFDANCIFRPLSLLPEWISDWVIVKMLRR